MTQLKTIFAATALALTATTIAAQSMPSVRWETLGNQGDGRDATYTQRFTVNNGRGLKRLCFNQFARKMEAINPIDTLVEIVPGYYYIASPRLEQDGAQIDIVTHAALRHYDYQPDGVHGVDTQGNPRTVRFTRTSIIDRPEQWSTAGADLMPKGDEIYDFNASLAYNQPLDPFNIIPSLKKVSPRESGGVSPVNDSVVEVSLNWPDYDGYQIDFTKSPVEVSFGNDRGRLYAYNTLQQLRANNPQGVPAAVVEDWPDFTYRGVMIDVSRNYIPLPEMQKIVQHMAHYRMNTLHFHLVDDEAWRLEINGLPELTDVGARRGYTQDEKDFLVQIFAGNGDPNATTGTANGYITRGEMVDFLRFCTSLGVDVIPEIESPGHARAAIKAMEARYRRTGDASLRLVEDGDTSSYTSAQAFHDNVMNPALEGPYKFMDIVTDELIAIWHEADAPLRAIHIGGDEVPAGAWNGAPSVKKMMAEKGMTEERQVHAAFVERIAKMLSDKGVKMSGWQEIAVGHSPEFDDAVAPEVYSVNFWTSSRGSRAAEAISNGFPVIISNVDHFYLDQAYNNHPLEKGLTWGGNVDEFTTLAGYPYGLCVVDEADRGGILGVSGHLFGETIRDYSQVESHLLPKMLGLAERAWNATATYSPDQFNAVVDQRELTTLARKGVNFHLRQPGVKLVDNQILMNSPYPSAVIRYTTDGTNPTADSPAYTSPISADGIKQIRASLFYLGKQSFPTIVYY
ncbi:MAG: family 20 glycosylhydrolase [Bacteroidales bacterium]|nr:family 20 glycosylhydrolase [Bacteroidales bacterium]